jgi:hypothetical protein
MLRSSAKVEKHYLKQPSTLGNQASGTTPFANSETNASRGQLLSTVLVVWWLVHAWSNRLTARKNLTLHLRETCYADLLAAPRKYRYGGPMWFARIAGKLFPASDLWVLLDSGNVGCHSSGEGVSPAEAQGELEANRIFVKMRKRYVILDALQPADRVTEDAYEAIIETLVQVTNEKLKRRL